MLLQSCSGAKHLEDSWRVTGWQSIFEDYRNWILISSEAQLQQWRQRQQTHQQERGWAGGTVSLEPLLSGCCRSRCDLFWGKLALQLRLSGKPLPHRLPLGACFLGESRCSRVDKYCADLSRWWESLGRTLLHLVFSHSAFPSLYSHT